MSDQLPLGRQIEAPQRYWPEVLVGVPRSLGREALGLIGLPFGGWDRWIAWEFAWQDPQGRRQIGILDMQVPADSPAMVESKSLKLYLNSCFYRVFADPEALVEELSTQISGICGRPVKLRYLSLAEAHSQLGPDQPQGLCLDHLVPEQGTDLLRVEQRAAALQSLYVSHGFRSLCPVTGQPDWASIFVEVRGASLAEAGLLGYLLGYAQHQGFHESCAEQIFTDIWRRCEPDALAVTARFTRRGGIEINPYRRSDAALLEQNVRLVRQ